MNNVYLKFYNASYFIVTSDSLDVLSRMSEYFSYRDPNYSIASSSAYDGYVRLLKPHNDGFTVPIGLFVGVINFLEEYNCNIIVDPLLNRIEDISLDVIKEFVDSLHLSKFNKVTGEYTLLTPYDYQLKGLKEFASYKNLTILSATGTGKSLMTYMICRYARTLGVNKILIITPRIGLVSQLKDNFDEYSHSDKTYDPEMCKVLGDSKNIVSPFTISTWQSLIKVPTSYFHQFDMVIVDECQHSDADVQKRIMQSSVNAFFRVGMSGSLKDNDASILQVTSLFGPSSTLITAKDAMSSGYITPVKINVVSLLYNVEDTDEYLAGIKKCKGAARFQFEVDTITSNIRRTNWFSRFLSNLDGNVLVLYDRKENHLKVEKRIFDTQIQNKNVHVISGDIKVSKRTSIKDTLEITSDNVLLATYGTFQMGESVDNISHVVLWHSSRSNVRILQTLGRGVRKHPNKEYVYLWDFVDIISTNPINYMFDQSLQRLEYYAIEGYSINQQKVKL